MDLLVGLVVVAAFVAVYAVLIRLAIGIDRVEQMRSAEDQQMIDRQMVNHLRRRYPEGDG